MKSRIALLALLCSLLFSCRRSGALHQLPTVTLELTQPYKFGQGVMQDYILTLHLPEPAHTDQRYVVHYEFNHPEQREPYHCQTDVIVGKGARDASIYSYGLPNAYNAKVTAIKPIL